jgi:hypothetical protein
MPLESKIRHIHDPVLLSLNMEGIRLLFVPADPFWLRQITKDRLQPSSRKYSVSGRQVFKIYVSQLISYSYEYIPKANVITYSMIFTLITDCRSLRRYREFLNEIFKRSHKTISYVPLLFLTKHLLRSNRYRIVSTDPTGSTLREPVLYGTALNVHFRALNSQCSCWRPNLL